MFFLYISYLFRLISTANSYGNTALHEAAHSGNAPVVYLLLEREAQITENHRGSTPLHTFAYSTNPATHPPAVFEALIQGGCTVRDRDRHGNTPSLVAVSAGRDDLLRLCLKYGASLKVNDDMGRDAHEIARFYGQEKMLKVLDEVEEEAHSHHK